MHSHLNSDCAALELFFALSKSSFSRFQYIFIHSFDASFFAFDPRAATRYQWHVQTYRIPARSGLQSTLASSRTMQDRGYEAVSTCIYELALLVFSLFQFRLIRWARVTANTTPERGHHQRISKIPNFSQFSGRLQKSTARGRHNGQDFTYLF